MAEMVNFLNIPKTYPTDVDVAVNFTVDSEMVRDSSDWIGVFKVGWYSTSDKITYQWAPPPLEDNSYQVLFHGEFINKPDCFLSS